MSVWIAQFCAGNMPHVTILLVLTNVHVIQDGQVMDKTALTLMSVHWDCILVLKIHTAVITRVAIRARVIEAGCASGLNHTAGVRDVIQPHFVLDMASACEMAHVIVLAITAEQTVRCAFQMCGVQVMESATLMELVIVIMAGLGNRWTVVYVFQRSCAVVMEHVTTTL